MFWLIILQIIPLINTFTQEIYCSEGQVGIFDKNYFPIMISDDNQVDYTLLNNQQLIEQIEECDLNVNNSLKLIHSQSIEDKLIQVYYGDEELFTLYFFEIQLDIFNSQIVKIDFMITNNISFKLINSTNIENIYKFQQNLIFVFNEQDYYLLYWFKNESLNYSLYNKYIIEKKDSCQDQLIQDQQTHLLYFSYVNCLDWQIYIVNSDGLELINFDDRHNNLILKSIHSFLYLYLIFPHIIYQKTFYDNVQKIVYENSEKQIESFISISESYQFFSIILYDDQFQLLVVDQNIITLVNEKPKNHIAYNNKIYLLFDDHLMCIENKYQVYHLPIEIDFLFFSDELQPYFFGYKETKIFIMLKNQNSPFFDCQDVKSNKTLYFKESNFNTYQFNEKQVQNIFVQIDQLKFLRPLQSFQKKIIKQILQNKHLKFSFKFNLYNYYNNFGLNLNIINDTQINCNLQEDFELTQCKIDKESILWARFDQTQTNYLMIFQTKQLSLYIKDCATDFQLFFGQFDEIDQYRTKVFQYTYVFLNKELNKIYALIIKSFSHTFLKILEFQEKIISIQQKTTALIVFLESCKTLCFDSITFFITSENCSEIQQEGSCKNNKIFQKFVIQFENQFLQLWKKNINIIIDSKVDQIIEFIPLEKFNDNAILAFYSNNEFFFQKITFFQNEFIENFKLPKYNFTYLQPPLYYYNGQYLVVMAQKLIKKELSYFLLIYKLDNILQEILVDVIQNIDIANFYIIGESTIVFQRNRTPYTRDLGEVEINCQIQNIFFKNSQTFIIQTIVQSKILEGVSENNTLILQVFNRIEDLFFKNENNKTIILGKDSKIDFDIKQFIFGPINQIVSENIDIEYPLIFIKEITCDRISQNYCLQEAEKKIINILNNKTWSYMSETYDGFLVLSNFFIIYQQNYYFCAIKIFDDKFHFLYELTIEDNVYIGETKIIDNYLFIMTNDNLNIYELGLNLIYIQGIYVNNINFKIQKVSNKQNSFILYNDQFILSHISYLQLNNQMRFDQIKLQIKTQSNEQMFYILQILIQQIIDYGDYLIAKILLLQNLEQSYFIDAKIDLIENTFEFQEKLLEIRIWSDISMQVLVTPNQIGFLGESYCFFIDHFHNFYLYNISKNQEFQTIDPIYCLNQPNTKLQIINETLILFESIDSSNHKIYEVSSYFFKISNQSNDKYSIKLINKVSELEFYFLVNNESNIKLLNLFIYIFIGILTLVICYQIICKKVNQRNLQKVKINQSQSEIEL